MKQPLHAAAQVEERAEVPHRHDAARHDVADAHRSADLVGPRLLFGLEDGAAPVPDPSLGAGDVTALAVGAGGEVRAVIDRRSIVGRDASGTWPELARSDDLAIDCLLATPSGVLAGTDEAHVLRLAEDGALVRDEAFDTVDGRDEWYTPWGGPPAVRSMALDLAGPESLPHRELVRRAARVLGTDVSVRALPYALALAFAWLAERLRSDPPLTPAMLGVLEHDDAIDPRPACDRLGIRLLPLDETLRRALLPEREPA